MARHLDEELPEESPRGPSRWALKVGIGFLLLVIAPLALIFASNSCNARPVAQPAQKVGRAEMVVSTPPAVPQARPEPRSVDIEPARRPYGQTGADVARPGTPTEPGAKAVDPLVTERRKRDFESRYASSLVVSFRPDEGMRHAAPSAAAPTADRRGGPGLPSTDEVVDKVIKAYGAANGGSLSMSPGMASPLPGVTPTPPERPSSGRPRSGGGSGPTTPDETPPIDDSGPLHRVLESSIIDAVLVNRLGGDNAAPIVGKVTNPLYSHDGAYVLIPADTKILGETRAVQQLGETRLVVVFHRLIFPDGRTKSLDQFKGLHVSGEMGLRDQVNHHYLSTLGAAAAISVVTGAGQAIGNRGSGSSGAGVTRVRWCRRRRRPGHLASAQSLSESAADDHDSGGQRIQGLRHRRHRTPRVSLDPVTKGTDMALPAGTADVAPKPPDTLTPRTPDTTLKQLRKMTAAAGKLAAPDPRKVAAQELANAQKALFDAEDALKAATEHVAAKTKAFDALRKAK